MWHKRSRATNDIFSQVNVNDRIQVGVCSGWYLSRVEDIKPGELHVACPIYRGSILCIKPDMEVTINIFAGLGLRQFRSKVKGQLNDRVPILILSDFVNMGSVHRRDHVRITDRIQLKCRLEGSSGAWWPAMTRDISSGGMQIVIDKLSGITSENFVDVELLLPEGGSVRATSRVIRTTPVSNSQMGVGLQFVQIDTIAHRKIIQYVQKKQTERSSASKKTVGSHTGR